MTETEKKALALVNEVMPEDCLRMAMRPDEANHAITFKALCRAIEQHEAFKREVSDAVEDVRRVVKPLAWDQAIGPLISRFIIANPDPLVEALTEAFSDNGAWEPCDEADANALRAALAARGLEIREKQP